jgi:hypothetical protein
LHRAEPERSPFIADATDRDDKPKALVNAAKFTAAYSRIAILAQQLNREAQLFEITELFFVPACTGGIRRARMSSDSLADPRNSANV